MIRRLFGILSLVLVAASVGAGSAAATTYYIAANGSDSNSGTSQTSPWLHAPGMNGCSANCASTTPQAGDKFIFRGGDTWHAESAAGSPVGLPWHWNWSGSSSQCQLNPHAGTVVKTSCIYLGVNTSWSSGSSWSRPQFAMDNPQTTSRPSGCKYDDTNVNGIELGSSNYVVIDNFELLGECWQGSTDANFIDTRGNGVEVSNSYFHGWTYASSSSTDNYGQIGGGTPLNAYSICDHNVFDGSDSSLGTTAGQASGMSLYNACTEIAYNVFSHVSNGCICTPIYVHDNLFQYLYEPQGSTHGNIVEWNNENLALPSVIYFYNNVIHDTNEGEGVNPEVVNAPGYIFNNISWRYRENSNGTNGTDGTNCFMTQVVSSTSFHYFNNSLDYPCGVTVYAVTSATTSIFQNNHTIGYPGSALTGMISDSGTTVTDNGNEVFQTESAANAQGYTISNAYAPTGSAVATVGAGANLSSTVCSGIGVSTLVSACETGIGTMSYDSTNNVVVYKPGNPRPSSGNWDAGAYQYSSSSSSSSPQAPTSLSATVN
jgi:hypothetical protein